MLVLKRTDSSNPDFIWLVKFLDAELAERDKGDHSFYDQFNKITLIKYVVLACENDQPISCGALKEIAPGKLEVKRMYTVPPQRGKGIASQVLQDLEKWAQELSYPLLVLETGKKQPEAIALYKKNGYSQITNYGQYAGVANSVCFEKEI